MKVTKTLLALAGATVALAALTTIASAAHLRFSSQTWRATWTSAEIPLGFLSRCSLTLEGSLHSATINKTIGSLIGYITRASIGPCVGGSATVLTATLPWHTQYAGFGGTLPAIASIVTRAIGMAVNLREGSGGPVCLWVSSTTHPVTVTYSLSGSVTRMTLGGTIPTDCGVEVTLRGTSATNSAQTVTLI